MEKPYKFWREVVIGGLYFVASLAIHYMAMLYATKKSGSPVADIILSNVPVYHLKNLIIYAYLFLIGYGLWLAWHNLKYLPFALKSIAFFYIVRAFFISLTHLGQFNPHESIGNAPILAAIGFKTLGDLFFSGHTGLPYLIALIFWEHKKTRAVYLVGSITLGVSMLLTHLHYSIDVFAAYFITYGIWRMAQKLFAADFEYAKSSTVTNL